MRNISVGTNKNVFHRFGLGDPITITPADLNMCYQAGSSRAVACRVETSYLADQAGLGEGIISIFASVCKETNEINTGGQSSWGRYVDKCYATASGCIPTVGMYAAFGSRIYMECFMMGTPIKLEVPRDLQ